LPACSTTASCGAAGYKGYRSIVKVRDLTLYHPEAMIARDTFETYPIAAGCRDNKFLACALEINAEDIVSGEYHLLELRYVHRTHVVGAYIFIIKVTHSS